MKLSEWAKTQGISYRTAWQWFKDKTLPIDSFVTKSGSIFVTPKENKIEEYPQKEENVIIYGRVSSNNKKQDLDSQIQLCEQYCISKGWIISKTYKEIASGMNDNRKMLNKILDNPPSKLVVLHKDRLTRFGFNYLSKLLKRSNCDVVVINNSNGCDNDDILKDFIAIITSFCCRLYGARRGQAKSLKLKEELIK